MPVLKDKTYIITGASRGIGRAIALRLAGAGANIVVAAKTGRPHPKLEGTIQETVRQVEEAGGRGLAVKTDVRFAGEVENMVAMAVKTFGGINGLINNAGAISLTGVEKTTPKLFDRMHQVNTRAVYLCARAAHPYLKEAENAHILSLSPPVNMDVKWLKDYSPYTVSKYGMTMLSLGMAAEFEQDGISVNTLWPATLIATAAIEFAVGGPGMLNHCRKPDIMADAAYEIVSRQGLSGNTLLDEPFLRECGYDDFDRYAYNPAYKDKIHPDIFL